MIGNGVWYVQIETGLISQRIQDGIFKILDVTAKFVFVFGEEFGVAGRWEMEDLSNHAGDTIVSAFDSQGSGLKQISPLNQSMSPMMIIMSYKVCSRTGTAEDDPFRVYP